MQRLATACVATVIAATFATGCSNSDGWSRKALFENPDVRLLVDAQQWHCVDADGQTACVQTPDGQDGWTCEDVDGHAACRMSSDEFVVQSSDSTDGTTGDPDRNTSDSTSAGQPYVSLGPNDVPDGPSGSTPDGTSPDGSSANRPSFDTIGADWECEWNEAAEMVVCVSIPEVGDDGDSKASSDDTAGQGGDGDGSTSMVPYGSIDWQCDTVEFGVLCVTDSKYLDELLHTDTGEGTTGSSSSSDEASKPKAGDFRTQTPGGWGAPAAGNNPGAYRDAHFADAFPEGLTIGCDEGHTVLFTDAAAIEAFMPAGRTPGTLDKDCVNPLKTSAGVLAGHLVALSLSVGFDLHSTSFGGSDLDLGQLVAAKGFCKGMTADQIRDRANEVLGGCDSDTKPSDILGCVSAINENFVDGDRAGGYLVLP